MKILGWAENPYKYKKSLARKRLGRRNEWKARQDPKGLTHAHMHDIDPEDHLTDTKMKLAGRKKYRSPRERKQAPENMKTLRIGLNPNSKQDKRQQHMLTLEIWKLDFSVKLL